MAELQVIGALRHKRVELAASISQLAEQLSSQQAKLAHLDATLRLFDPTIRPEEIRPLRRRWQVLLKGQILMTILPLYGQRLVQPEVSAHEVPRSHKVDMSTSNTAISRNLLASSPRIKLASEQAHGADTSADGVHM